MTNDADKVHNTKKKCRGVARERNDWRKKQGKLWAGNGPKSHMQGEEARRHSKTAYKLQFYIWTLVIMVANYPDRLGPSGKFVENSTKLSGL
jgi:hypothetical protein